MKDIDRLLKAKIPCPETGIEVKHTICDICSPTCHCGVDAYVKDGKIIKVEGTREHPLNQGVLCTKGAANRDYIYREDRIKTPLRRVGARGEGRFEPITWDEAYTEIGARLNAAKETCGPNSVAFFSGFSKWYRPIFKRFAYSFGSTNYATESSVCFESTVIAWKATAGMFSVPDVEHTKVFLGWALNPHYSDHLTAFNVLQYKEHGGKVIIVDPRKTPAVDKYADIHLQLRPGTDGALALGMAKLIIENGWQDQEFIDKHTYGYEEYAEYVKQFDLDRVAGITGLSPDDIYEATKLFATAHPAAVHQSASPVTHHHNGFQNYRALISLCALTGNYDCPGGVFPMPPTYTIQCAGFPTREHEFADEVKPTHGTPLIGAGRFPVWDAFMDEFQAMDLTRTLEEGTPYPVKALFGLGINARMFPETGRFLKALGNLDFFVAADLFLTDTCKYADIVLPSCSSFERGEYKVYPGGFSLFTKPVIPPLYESKSDVDMLCELAKHMNLGDPLLEAGYKACVNDIIRDLSVTVESLEQSDFPVMTPEARPPMFGACREHGFPTPTGKFEFKCSVIEKFPKEWGVSAIPTWTDPLEDEEPYPFTLTSGARLPNAIHSRAHDVPTLRSLRPDPLADIHPDDAAAAGVSQGDMVELYNAHGSIRMKANLTTRVRPGNIHIYHGYREANANDLIGAAHLDPCTGFPGFKSAGCHMRRCEEEKA